MLPGPPPGARHDPFGKDTRRAGDAATGTARPRRGDVELLFLAEAYGLISNLLALVALFSIGFV